MLYMITILKRNISRFWDLFKMLDVSEIFLNFQIILVRISIMTRRDNKFKQVDNTKAFARKTKGYESFTPYTETIIDISTIGGPSSQLLPIDNNPSSIMPSENSLEINQIFIQPTTSKYVPILTQIGILAPNILVPSPHAELPIDSTTNVDDYAIPEVHENAHLQEQQERKQKRKFNIPIDILISLLNLSDLNQFCDPQNDSSSESSSFRVNTPNAEFEPPIDDTCPDSELFLPASPAPQLNDSSSSIESLLPVDSFESWQHVFDSTLLNESTLNTENNSCKYTLSKFATTLYGRPVVFSEETEFLFSCLNPLTLLGKIIDGIYKP